ncbi:hypothetical protein PQY68_01540 [Planktomarina temperata]|nr:hypothetical protein [Planktomarina temperata]
MKGQQVKFRKQDDPKVFRRIPVGYMLFGILPLSACGGGGDKGGDLHEETFNLSGEVVKGPVSGAIVFVDYNGDGQLTAGEPSQRTSESGGFSFLDLDNDGPVIALTDDSSVDTSSGLVIDGMRLTAPEGALVISPLTTIMKEGNLSNTQVVAALNLPDVELKSFNPFTSENAAATNLAVEVAAQQVSAVVRSISTAIQQSGVSGADAADIAGVAVADTVASVGIADFTSHGFITTAIEKSISELSPSQASSVSAIASEIATATANVNEVISASTDLTSPETKDAFGLIVELTKQIGEAITNDGDASRITFTDADTITDDDQVTNEATVSTPETSQNATPTGAVKITGTARQGETLTAVTSTLADTDGLGVFSYQWKADGAAISAATSNSLTLAETQVGKIITVEVSYTDGRNNQESLLSSATSLVKKPVDDVGPAITAMSLESDTVTVGDTVRINYQVEEATGTDVFVFWYKDQNNNEFRVVDNDADGVAELIIQEGYLAGDYTPYFVSTLDTSPLSNSITYLPDSSTAGDVGDGVTGFDLSQFVFTVNNSQPVDDVGPAITAMSLESDTVTVGDTVRINYQVEEATGTDVFVFWYKDQNNNEFRVVDNDADGVAELIIQEGYLAGDYTPYFVSTLDTSPLSNSITYLPDSSTAGDVGDGVTGFDLSQFGFTVI